MQCTIDEHTFTSAKRVVLLVVEWHILRRCRSCQNCEKGVSKEEKADKMACMISQHAKSAPAVRRVGEMIMHDDGAP